MGQQLSVGQRVQIKGRVEKYGGLFGRIIHRERVTGRATYRREHPEASVREGQLRLVVQLEKPPAGVEPVILCSEEQVSRVPLTQ